MTMQKKTVAELVAMMEAIAPQVLAAPWDNVGMQVGHGGWPVNRIMVALDPAPDVVADACEKNIDLLITHHPLIFQPLKTVDFNTPIGSMLWMAARHQLAIFAAHTNFDAVAGGLNDILAEKLGLENPRRLVETAESSNYGFGRVGQLPRSDTLSVFAGKVRDRLGVAAVRCVGIPDMPVRTVALCTGSGGSLLDAVLACGADVFVTGDIKYHDARTAEWAGLGLVDIGHFASEHLMVDALAHRLRELFIVEGVAAEVHICALEKDPFIIV